MPEENPCRQQPAVSVLQRRWRLACCPRGLHCIRTFWHWADPIAVAVSRLPPQIATADKRRELLSHSLLKSYQTQASAQGGGADLTVGLLVPHVRQGCCGSWLACYEPDTRQRPSHSTAAGSCVTVVQTFTLLTVAPDRLRQYLFQRPWLPLSATHRHVDSLLVSVAPVSCRCAPSAVLSCPDCHRT